MNPNAIAKLKMYRASRRCLVFGLLGFIPMIGLVFALIALWISGTVRQKEKQLWNAAKPYRVAGAICAGVTAVLWSGLLMLVFGNLLWFLWAKN
jgi:branched-subunit amino acid transport protein